MNMKFNFFQFLAALLCALCFFILPMAFIGVPGIRIPLLPFTGLTIMSHISQWFVFPLGFSLALLLFSFVNNRAASLLVGGVSIVGMIVLGACMRSILINSDIASFVSQGIGKLIGNPADVSSLLATVGGSCIFLHYGYWLYLLFNGLFLFFSLFNPAQARKSRAGNRSNSPSGGAGASSAQQNRHSGMYR